MKMISNLLLGAMLLFGAAPVFANDESAFASAMANFKRAHETKHFFNQAYGYAIFPTVGKGGFVVGAAYGKGRVYKRGVFTGNATLTQVSVGFQLGGQAFSEIIFFKDEKAYRDFTSGSFEFSGQISAVAINAGVNVQAGTTGNSASAGQSGGVQEADASYVNGMAVFTSTKGGLMYEAALAGQSFTFEGK